MADARILRLVDAHAAARARVQSRALRAVLRLVAGMADGWSDPRRVAAFSREAAAVVNAAQRTVSGSTAEFLDQVLDELGVARTKARFELQENLRQVDPDVEWSRPAEQYRYERSRGTDEAAAQKAAAARAELLADADIRLGQLAATVGRLQQYPQVTGYRRVIHPELSAGGTCGLCAVASDRVYRVDQLLPVHGRCVSGETIIGAADVSALTRRRYPGPLVALRSANGEELRVTANHPVLTATGWVPAGLVNVGDQIVRNGLGHRVVAGGPDEQQRPTSVEELWRSATVDIGLRPRSVPLAPEDFHGDGTDGEVDVVATNGFLPDVGHVSFSQPSHQTKLVGAGAAGGLLAPQGAGMDHGISLSGAPDRFVRRCDHRLPLSTGRAGVAGDLGFAPAAHLHFLLRESGGDDGAVYAQRAGDRQDRLAVRVAAHDRVLREAQPSLSRFDPAFAEFAGEGRLAYAKLGADLRDRLAGRVELDRVIDKGWVEGPHHVYNLQTAEGWYSAGGMIVSNCHCGVMPVTAKFDVGSAINTADLERLYTETGSNAAEDLKRVRYRVVEHSELGPQLIAA